MTPFSDTQVRALAQQYRTPLWVYDAETVRARIAQLKSFDTIRFAQKACSNIHLLRLMKQAGVWVDAVSLGEIERAQRAGLTDTSDPLHAELVFTADLIDRPTLDKVVADRIPVNAGSIDMLAQLGEVAPGHPVWLRINPGFGHGHSNKTNTGGEHSKHGIWHTDLPLALATVKRHGLRLIGLHMHIGSGVDYHHLEQVCGAMVALVGAVHAQGHDLQAISAGGGLSIPYAEGDAEVDTAHYFSLWDAARQKAAAIVGHALRLEIEPGRFLVAQSGVLIAEVRAVKDMGANHFVLIDAGFNDLMRPALYGSHHGISVVANGRPDERRRQPTVVAGPLCESGDVFTQLEGGVVSRRELPPAHVGDLLVFHDTGAYGATMSSNYKQPPLDRRGAGRRRPSALDPPAPDHRRIAHARGFVKSKPMVPDSLPIRQVLAQHEPLLHLQQRLCDSDARLDAVRSCLPPALLPHIKAGPLDENQWTLLVSNQAVAAKLKHLQPHVEMALSAQGWPADCVLRIKVQPTT